MVSCAFTTAVVAAVALSATQVQGHGFLVKPKPSFQSGIDITSYTGTMMGDAIYPGFAFNTAPSINMENFVKNFKNDTRHPNLKTLVEKNQKVIYPAADAKCGWTDPSKTSEPLEGTSIIYGRNFEGTGEGFVHPGPCETWCDDVMVQQDMHCDETYNVKDKAAIIPIDAAKCKGAKQLHTYWIAMHGNEWQIYLDCVGLSGATSGGSSSSTPSATAKTPSATTKTPSATTKTPSATTKTPAATTKAPVASDADEYPSPAPAATTKAPTTAPKTTVPSPTKKKCTAKTSRMLIRKKDAGRHDIRKKDASHI
ncbi:hypothetical protein Gpo141_00010876 [Globisporangium polare]